MFSFYNSLVLTVGLFVFAKSNRLPQFSQEMTAVSIDEEKPPGVHITRATAIDYDGDKIQYSIEDDENGFFTINSENGEVQTAKRIDRETLAQSSYQLSFKVIASEVKRPDQKSSHTVHVIVLDINDNPPEFPPEKMNQVVNMSENTPHDTFVMRMSAKDADNNELFYFIEAGNELEYFKINFDTGRIVTNKQLDYEAQDKFALTVAVVDGRPKEPGVHKSLTKLYVNVLDEDDNGAKFDRNYTVPIIEGKHKEILLMQVHAEDQDKGMNKPVHYSIENAASMGGIFSINKDGDIFVNGEIDREKSPIYVLQLRAAEDGERGSYPKHPPAQATLTVAVADINDNVPEFTQKEYIGYMTEHEEIGFKVTNVEATDEDEGKNAEFLYRLVGDDADAFAISQDGVITVQKDIDREKKFVYGFKVQAIQDGIRQHSTAEVTIIIRDKNDHTPVFKKSSYYATIPENSFFNSTILTVSASDEDFEKNGEVRYSISSADADSACFRIDPITGEIRLVCKLDREVKDNYSFLVKASDQSGDGNERSGHVQVKVKVQDLNDNFPIFSPTEYYKSINYDEDIGATIIKLTATDKDAGSFGKVFYRIRSGNQEDKFQIKKETGALLVSSSLADLSGQFVIEIEAYDNDGARPSLQSSKNAYVTIKVEKKGFNSVVLNMRVKTPKIVQEKYNIENELQAILDIGIKTDDIQGGEARDTTKYIFHAYNKESFAVVKWDEVLMKIEQKQSHDFDEFMRKWNVTFWEKYGAKPTEVTKLQQQESKNTEAWTPIIYAVLGFSALIVIFGIFGIVYLIRSRRRYDDGGASQTSSRLPITATARHRSQSYWNDPGFESVSQIHTESYVHSSGFLSRSCDKYELDPSNLYSKEGMYSDDPFSVIIERPPTASPRSSDDASSHASSGFAASSVMTVYRSPHPNSAGGGGDGQPLLHHSYKPSTGRNGVSPRDRKLSVIVDEDGTSKQLLDMGDHKRPPSYEYDFDEKVPDDYDD